MSIVLPVRLDSEILISNENDSFSITQLSDFCLTGNYDFFDLSGMPIKVNGYDSSHENEGRGLRITNLCGTLNGEILKLCPKCGQVKNFYHYGVSYRTTNEKRDQSECEVCRSNYQKIKFC